MIGMGKHRWYIYKSRVTSRWVVWNPGWDNMGDNLLAPMKFDTWQQAIDYVYRKVKL